MVRYRGGQGVESVGGKQWRIYTRAQALVNLACALVNL